MTQPLSSPGLTAALFETSSGMSRVATCPLCHTPHASLTQETLQAGGDWRCFRCGQRWDARRFATVAAYAVWVAEHERRTEARRRRLMEAIADVVHKPNHAVEDEALAARYAATTILITAEHAAAVVHLARTIHAASDRAASPFEHVAAATLPIDAAALTETCAALLDTACGGSLLLTDVEQMPAIVQNRLLETFARLHAARAPTCHVRLMAGTTTTLYERVSDGTFSERLFYGLNIIHVVGKTVLDASAPAGGVG